MWVIVSDLVIPSIFAISQLSMREELKYLILINEFLHVMAPGQRLYG